MVTLSQAKTLGGIGSILALLSMIPSVGWILGLIGLVLILAAVKYISDSLEDKSVFNNILISVILGIIGIVITMVFAAAVVLSYYTISGGFKVPSISTVEGLTSFITSMFLVFLPLWIFMIVSAIFLRRSYDVIASKLNIGIFRTTAYLYLVGAILSIVLVGFILIFIADILQVVAYFSIPEETPQTSKPALQPT